MDGVLQELLSQQSRDDFQLLPVHPVQYYQQHNPGPPDFSQFRGVVNTSTEPQHLLTRGTVLLVLFLFLPIP